MDATRPPTYPYAAYMSAIKQGGPTQSVDEESSKNITIDEEFVNAQMIQANFAASPIKERELIGNVCEKSSENIGSGKFDHMLPSGFETATFFSANSSSISSLDQLIANNPDDISLRLKRGTREDLKYVWNSYPYNLEARRNLGLPDFNIFSLTNAERAFLLRVDSWVLADDSGQENRTSVARTVWKAYREYDTVLKIYSPTITTLPPIPPRIIELFLSTPALKELLADLSQLKLLALLSCEKIEMWSADFSSAIEIHGNLNGNLNQVSGIVKWMLEDQVESALAKRLTKIDSAARTAIINPPVIQNYRQNYSRSCGAACLLSIARSFYCSNNPALAETLEKYPVMRGACPLYRNGSPLKFFYEEGIYQITSGYQGDITDLEKARGSFPPKIIQAATVLGLKSTMYVDPANNDGITIMNHTSMLDIRSELAQASVTVNEFIPTPLEKYELEMRLLVYVDGTGQRAPGLLDETTHWVVFMPDGSLMDPGTGASHADLEKLNAIINTVYQLPGLLKDSGILIRFKY